MSDDDKEFKTLDRKTIQRYCPKKEWTSDDNIFSILICPICNDQFEEGNSIRKIRICNHIFHSKCFFKSIIQKEECPVCELDLTKEELIKHKIIPSMENLASSYHIKKINRSMGMNESSSNNQSGLVSVNNGDSKRNLRHKSNKTQLRQLSPTKILRPGVGTIQDSSMFSNAKKMMGNEDSSFKVSIKKLPIIMNSNMSIKKLPTIINSIMSIKKLPTIMNSNMSIEKSNNMNSNRLVNKSKPNKGIKSVGNFDDLENISNEDDEQDQQPKNCRSPTKIGSQRLKLRESPTKTSTRGLRKLNNQELEGFYGGGSISPRKVFAKSAMMKINKDRKESEIFHKSSVVNLFGNSDLKGN